eukprot:m.22412 g.22412  ORF g.22412 m.22412 type:complete len:140 (+) comp5452_c0_seq2:49-468(+)
MSGKVIKDSLRKELLVSNNLEDQAFADLIDNVFEILTSTLKIDDLEQNVADFVEKSGVKAKTIESSFRGWLSLFRDTQKANTDLKTLFEELKEIGFPKGKAQFVLKKYKEHEQNLSKVLIGTIHIWLYVHVINYSLFEE